MTQPPCVQRMYKSVINMCQKMNSVIYIYIYAHYASTENWLFVKNGDTDVGNAVTHEIWKVCMLVVKMIDENN